MYTKQYASNEFIAPTVTGLSLEIIAGIKSVQVSPVDARDVVVGSAVSHPAPIQSVDR